MPIDVDRARALTPGAQHVNHLNNAGSSLPPQPVIDAVVGHVHREAMMGGYEAEKAVASELEGVYEAVATLINADADEIALVENSTRGWNAVFFSIPFQPGDRVLTGRSEYVSNAINLLLATERFGIEIVVIDDDEHGQISVDGLRAAIDDRTKLIALAHVPTGSGLVNPAGEVGRIARDAGIFYLLDACQSAGQLPLDVNDLGCDALCSSARKFLRGPRGTGFLHVRRDALDVLQPAELDVRSAQWTEPYRYEMVATARRFETFESSVACRLGLGAAVQHALEWGLADIAERTSALAASLRSQLSALPRVHVHDKGLQKCGIVTFSVDGTSTADVQARLGEHDINTSITEPAFAQFDLPARGLDRLVRASPHYYNTDDEIGRLVEVVAALG